MPGFFSKSEFKWYEHAWAMLPIGLTAVGGAIGGAFGGLAWWINVWLLRRWPRGWLRYVLVGANTAAAVTLYLVAARLVVAGLGLAWLTPAQIDRQLAATPVLVAIHAADPAAYAQMRAAMLDAAAKGRPQADITAIAQATIGLTARKYLPLAADGDLLDFTRVMTLELDQIGARSADSCVAFMYPHLARLAAPVTEYITPEVAQRDIAATQAVIASGSANPAPMPSRASVAPALGQVRDAMIAAFGTDDVATLARPATLPHDRLCAMSAAIYKQALTLPRSAAVPLLRFLFAQQPGT